MGSCSTALCPCHRLLLVLYVGGCWTSFFGRLATLYSGKMAAAGMPLQCSDVDWDIGRGTLPAGKRMHWPWCGVSFRLSDRHIPARTHFFTRQGCCHENQ